MIFIIIIFQTGEGKKPFILDGRNLKKDSKGFDFGNGRSIEAGRIFFLVHFEETEFLHQKSAHLCLGRDPLSFGAVFRNAIEVFVIFGKEEAMDDEVTIAANGAREVAVIF